MQYLNNYSQHLKTLIINQQPQKVKKMIRDLTHEIEQQMRQNNKYEDLLDVFINIIIKRSPTVFVLVNMTLMIWLVQTIYSSRLDSVPRSIYFFAPFFNAQPIIGLYATTEDSCKSNFQQITLKTFPTIKSDHINRQNLTKWGMNSIIFCAQTSKTKANFSLECLPSETYCSGYCVNDKSKCPITSIKKLSLNETIPIDYSLFYNDSSYSQIYIYSRSSKSDYIVGLSAQYQDRCANDYKYYDKYENFNQYWNQTSNCGDQGPLPAEVYKIFEEIPAKIFLFNNGIWSQSIDNNANTQASIGSVSLIKFSNKSVQCSKAEYFSKDLSNNLLDDPVKPTFTQSMLIIAFVFFTLSWAWLVGFYCFDGLRKEKNIIVVLMCIIELIVICFLYCQNKQMFQTEQLISQIAKCIQTQLQATSHWEFGITNSSPFISIMFVCTCFLLLELVAHIIDKNFYVPYYQSHPNLDQNCF